MIYPLVTGFHWADFDFQWYIEGLPQPAGAREDRERLSQRGDLHQSARASGHDNITIPAYVAGVIAGKMPPGTTPLQVADQIDARADRVLSSIAEFSQT